MHLTILLTMLMVSGYVSAQSNTQSSTITSSASLSCAAGDAQTYVKAPNSSCNQTIEHPQQIRVLLLVHLLQNRRVPRRGPRLRMQARKRGLQLSHFLLPHAYRSRVRGIARAKRTMSPCKFPGAECFQA